MPILGGNSDDVVSTLSKMGTLVLVLLLLLINFTWHKNRVSRLGTENRKERGMFIILQLLDAPVPV